LTTRPGGGRSGRLPTNTNIDEGGSIGFHAKDAVYKITDCYY
jgi:hypothetical protein